MENNYFGTHKNSKSILKYYDATTSSNTATLSHIYASGNIPNLSSSNTSSDSNLETATAIDSSTDTFNTHIVSTKPWTIDYSYTLEKDDDVYLNFELSEVPIEGKSGKAKVYVNNKLVYENDIYCEKIINKKSKSFFERFKIW